MEIFSIPHLLPPIYHIFTCVDPDPGSYSEDGSGFTKLLNRYRYGSNLDPDQPQATTLLNIEVEEAQNYQPYRTNRTHHLLSGHLLDLPVDLLHGGSQLEQLLPRLSLLALADKQVPETRQMFQLHRKQFFGKFRA